MTIQRRMLLAGAVAAVVASLSESAVAQSYPKAPIKLVVPFSPGGGTDILSRLLANKIGANTGWTFVVDNKPGAGGNIGMDAVAKAKPDGYTLGMGQTAPSS